MIALIFAGGFGERMKPVTPEIPKSLMHYKGGVLLSHWIHCLLEDNIEHIVLDTYPNEKALTEYVTQLPKQIQNKISIIKADRLKPFQEVIQDNRSRLGHKFLLIYPDTYIPAPCINHFIHSTQNDSVFYIGVTYSDDVSSQSFCDIGMDGRVIDFKEKPGKMPGYFYSGISAFTSSVLDFAKNMEEGLTKDIFPRLAKGGLLKVVYLHTAEDIGASLVDYVERRVGVAPLELQGSILWNKKTNRPFLTDIDLKEDMREKIKEDIKQWHSKYPESAEIK